MPLKSIMQVQSSWPQKATPCVKTRHTMYRSLRSVHPFFLHNAPFHPPTPKKSYYTVFQSAKKCLFPGQHLHSHIMYVTWSHQIQNFELHLSWFSRFCTAHSTETLYFTILQRASKSDLELVTAIKGRRLKNVIVLQPSLNVPAFKDRTFSWAQSH